jgi:hypothetical protein
MFPRLTLRKAQQKYIRRQHRMFYVHRKNSTPALPVLPHHYTLLKL